MKLQEEYRKLIAKGKVKEDSSQIAIIDKLELLRTKLEEHFNSGSKLLKKIIPFPGKNHNIPGMYIYGEVGTGKSMLMDLFYNHTSLRKKKRIHFHAFMLEIHNNLHKWRQENRNNAESGDPIPIIAKQIATQTMLLCFDELQVTDIADAMILGRLFSELFKNGVIIVTTSNRAPEELYKDGLQRERFLPFIDLIKNKLEVINLNTKQDYRLLHIKNLSRVYYTPLDNKANAFLTQIFNEIAGSSHYETYSINIKGRNVVIPKYCNGVAWASFDDLCRKPLGAEDYITIAKTFQALIIENIPQMGKDMKNEAKRFVTLIDNLYEHKVKLIITAEVAPELLYTSGTGSFEFKRTISRLLEMQTHKYLAPNAQ